MSSDVLKIQQRGMSDLHNWHWLSC